METRRGFIKNIIATTAEASTGGAGVAKSTDGESHRTPGRRLPLYQLESFMQELSVAANVTPTTMTQINPIVTTYMSPIVDTAGFASAPTDISVAGCITISSSAT